ncbi:Alpha-mannosidase 2C1 [Nowakowskiella sp. JEL0407]|nr:Alpha-mannosidase 2C1 [Nowakowskiella sp. JEL0407]
MVFAKAGSFLQIFNFYIEIACNGMFGVGNDGLINPPDPNRYFKLVASEIVVYDQNALDLRSDMEVLVGVAKELPTDSQISADALFAANEIVNTVHVGNPQSLEEAKRVSWKFFESRKGDFVGDHIITAIGNCHIDTAWLWPFDETKRKVARSWSRQIGLMNEYPDFTFAASQAQQFEWLKLLYPKLFQLVQEKSLAGQFIPIGGTWVEMDCNLPSGESLCRQFLYGQTFYEQNFGKRCNVFWLPDTFGYSAQLPQIVKESGLKYFFTQKLSWNNINKFPHTTFNWIGLDGTPVLTHFSPADTYTAQADVKDVTFMVKNNKDKGYTNKSLLVYGNGDGGGGPLKSMLERIERMKNVKGMPATIKHGDPTKFYEELETTSRDLASWKGELYFELHRGTYTSQAKTKKYNRTCERLLQTAEKLSSIALNYGKKVKGFNYSKTEFDRLWKLVLLNQFHDVLPGSSIGLVYKDANKFHEDVISSSSQIQDSAFTSLVSSLYLKDDGDVALVVFNPTSWKRSSELIEFDIAELKSPQMKSYFNQLQQTNVVQMSKNEKLLAIVENIPGYGVKSYSLQELPNGFKPVSVRFKNAVDNHVFVDDSNEYHIVEPISRPENAGSADVELVIIETAFFKASFDWHGRLHSLVDVLCDDREVIPKNGVGNVFKFFEDMPLFWDAWDVEIYHLEKHWDAPVGEMIAEEYGPLRVVMKVEHQISSTSKIIQRIIISAVSPVIEFDTTVEWNENRKLLKVEFPVDIMCDFATYETQFGYIQRPTHYNTSWDMARFEVCAHKFVDFSEHGYGVALFNDCKYGHSVKDNLMRITLLKSAKAPDFNADVGVHRFRYGLHAHKGNFHSSNVVQLAAEFNTPIMTSFAPISKPFDVRYFSLPENTSIVLDTVKPAEDFAQSGDIVLRFYESLGGRGRVKVETFMLFKSAWICNVMEDKISKLEIGASEEGTGSQFEIEFTPFKIVSVRLGDL